MEDVLHEEIAVKRIETGEGIPDICRELGVRTAMFYKWGAKYDGWMSPCCRV